MKGFGVVLLGVGVAFGIYGAIEVLSSDALGMAVGLVFGVLAGLPTAALVLASRDQRDSQDANQMSNRQPRQLWTQEQNHRRLAQLQYEAEFEEWQRQRELPSYRVVEE